MEWLKTKWTQFINIITGNDKNWDGEVDIKEIMIAAQRKAKS